MGALDIPCVAALLELVADRDIRGPSTCRDTETRSRAAAMTACHILNPTHKAATASMESPARALIDMEVVLPANNHLEGLAAAEVAAAEAVLWASVATASAFHRVAVAGH